MKEAEAVNSIPSTFLKFVSSCLSSSARWLKCIFGEIRRFSVGYEISFGVLTAVTYKICFSHHYDFPYNIYTNSKQHVLLMD